MKLSSTIALRENTTNTMIKINLRIFFASILSSALKGEEYVLQYIDASNHCIELTEENKALIIEQVPLSRRFFELISKTTIYDTTTLYDILSEFAQKLKNPSTADQALANFKLFYEQLSETRRNNIRQLSINFTQESLEDILNNASKHPADLISISRSIVSIIKNNEQLLRNEGATEPFYQLILAYTAIKRFLENPLLSAFVEDDLELFKDLTKDNLSQLLNEIIFEKMTFLHLCAYCNSQKICDFLLKQEGIKANTLLSSVTIGTPLYIAAKKGHVEIAKAFIHHSVDVNLGLISSSCSTPHTPLFIATVKNQPMMVALLLEAGAQTNSSAPLSVAAGRGYLDIVKLLLPKSQEYINQLYQGATPLLAAVRGSHLHVVNYLLEHHGSMSASISDSLLLCDAAYTGDVGIVQSIVKAYKKSFKQPLDAKARESFKNWLDNSILNDVPPLFLAAARGYSDIVSYLVEQGADINQTTQFGEAPLEAAVRYNHADIVQFLVEKQARINPYLLKIGLKHNATESTLFLISNKYVCEHLKLEKLAQHYGSPIYIAAQNANIPVVEFLAQNGVPTFWKASGNDTPLNIALRTRPIELACELFTALCKTSTFSDPSKMANTYNEHHSRFLSQFDKIFLREAIGHFMANNADISDKMTPLEKYITCFQSIISKTGWWDIHNKFYKNVLKELKNVINETVRLDKTEASKHSSELFKIMEYQRSFFPTFFSTSSSRELSRVLNNPSSSSIPRTKSCVI